MSAALAATPGGTLEQLIADALLRIQVGRDQIDHARERRDQVVDAMRAEFPGCRIYVNGSVAHGDALHPLNDVDLGVVVLNEDGFYGPGRRGPADLQERAVNAVKKHLKRQYPNLRVKSAGQKRSIVIYFGETGREDFTADLIVAVDNVGQRGLYIPNYQQWDRADPERHVELVLTRLKATNADFAAVVRLVKHWNRGKSDPPLHSWNIKALALASIYGPTALIPGLQAWFTHAAAELAKEYTPDPAGVSRPVKTKVEPRQEAARVLRKACEFLEEAITLERQGFVALAHERLAKMFNDPEMLPFPEPGVVLAEQARWLKANAKPSGGAAVSARPTPPVRSWAP